MKTREEIHAELRKRTYAAREHSITYDEYMNRIVEIFLDVASEVLADVAKR